MTDTPPAVDLDLLLVHSFTLVAEHGHFGRAAEALHVTQPSLSRQINRLEKQLGARLLDRGPRGTRLTEAGAVFLPQAKALLRNAARAVAQTRAAASPGHVTIGYTGDLIITPVVREMRRRHPDAEIRAQHIQLTDVPAALLDHRVDALVTRLPFVTTDLHVTILYAEPRVVLMPIDHRLAHKDFLTLDDIADEPVPRLRHSDPAWSAYWNIDPRPDGRPAPEGPIIEALEDKLEVIAAGEAVAITAGGQFPTLRPDVIAIPLHGVDPAHVVLATRRDTHNRLVTAFAKYALEQLAPATPPTER
ncbi:LysR family transcriptional regulator [Nocardia macrotermitis]|uniref:HTH-type transcriptional regulator HdfR n=1 Tax=Nocardia macrotermitis TaxID=2585198 RepID=A0A7K0DGM0_9NOCA|nr:LysR substrate-binding domain-containing protein [Nocardia macrotermitis]MQY23934.1 HTH-type transcriptional regulator HdfR [Nocardia macrotermitis]